MQNIPTRLTQVFWGLVIVAVDLHLGRFDVLPDFVGYILVALGTGGLLALSAQFKVARMLSWVLVPVSLLPWLFQGSLLKLVWWLRLPLDGAMIWFLLGGVIEFAGAKQRSELGGQAGMARLAYAGLLGVSFLLALLAHLLPGLAGFLAKLTYVATMMVLVGILYLVYQVKRTAAASESQPAEPEQLKPAA